MLINIQPDKHKAKSLVEIAKVTLSRLKETDKVKYPLNTLTDYYDILRQLMSALLLIEGVKIKGEGAHFEIINQICTRFGLEEQTKVFLQELRDYRNRISYEGFVIKPNYIKANAHRIDKIIDILENLIDERLKEN